MSSTSPTVPREIETAVALSETAFANIDANASDYTLIRAERIIPPGAQCQGVRCWRLTYKHTSLLPTTADSEVGKGGEIFVQVDIDGDRASVTGYGE